MLVPESPETQHPEVPKLINALGTFLGQWNDSKMKVEYLLQSLDAKGLLPDPEGNAPEGLGVVTVGEVAFIGGTSYTYASYLNVILCLRALVTAVVQLAYEGGPTIQTGLVDYARS